MMLGSSYFVQQYLQSVVVQPVQQTTTHLYCHYTRADVVQTKPAGEEEEKEDRYLPVGPLHWCSCTAVPAQSPACSTSCMWTEVGPLQSSTA